MSRVSVVTDPDEAVAGIADGSTVLVGGFGMAGMPVDLIDALIRQGASDLTVVSNNAGNGDTGLAALLAAGQVRKVICSFPRQTDSYVFDGLYRDNKIELELVTGQSGRADARGRHPTRLVRQPRHRATHHRGQLPDPGVRRGAAHRETACST